MSQLAPIGVCTYTRINHLKQTIEALQKNTLASRSDLYIFSDAPKQGDEEKVAKVRNYLHTIDGFKTVNIFERETNSYIENTRDGFKQLLDEYGRAIVMEDDIVTAPGFLQFMNDALNFYEDDKNILSVSGYAPNLNYFNSSSHDVYLSKRFHGWGVGYWREKYILVKDISSSWAEILQDKKTLKNLKGMGSDMLYMIRSVSQHQMDAFDVKACYLCAKFGYANVLPTKTLVKNIGMDGSGVHCSNFDIYSSDSLNNKIKFTMINDIKFDNAALREYEKFFSRCVAIDQIIMNKAVESLNNGSNTEALMLLDQAVALRSDLPSLAYGRVVALARLNRIEESIAALENLLEEAPSHPKAQTLLTELKSLSTLQRQQTGGRLFNYGQNFYGPVLLTPRTLANIATSVDLWKELLSFHRMLITDEYVDYLDSFYRESIERFGSNWRYMDIVNVLFAASKTLQPANYLEIGVRRGRSVCAVVRGCQSVNIVAFDIWMEGYAGMENPGPDFVRSELKKHNHTGEITFIDGDSHKTVPDYFTKYPDIKFDIITVDGDHSEEGAFEDLCVVIPHLAVGGIVVFDDISHPAHPYLLSVWRKTLDRFPFLSGYEFTEIGYGVAFAIRKAE